MPQKTPYVQNPVLTAIAIAFKNGKMIADSVLPRVPVGKRDFKYTIFPKEEVYTLPESRVGRRGKVNQVSFTGTEQTASVEDFGLEDPIPNDDIENAPEGYDPRGHSIEYLMNLIDLGREKRVAELVFGAATYGTNNKMALSGTDMFSDPTSNPIAVIMDALDSMLMRGNVMTIGRVGFSALAQHPMIIKAVLGNSGDKGIATREQIARLFELDEILVGESYINTAKKGQEMSVDRVWGASIALTHRDRLANTQRGMTFGMTAEYGTRAGWEKPDDDIGLRGGIKVRTGESLKELITAPDLGYLIQNIA